MAAAATLLDELNGAASPAAGVMYVTITTVTITTLLIGGAGRSGLR